MTASRFVLLVGIVAFSATTLAEAKPALDTEVKASVSQALAVLQDPKLADDSQRNLRQSKLRAVSDGMFDWEKVAQRSLGAPWRKLSAADRKRFQDAFHELLVSTYLKQLDRFRELKELAYLKTEPEGQEATVSYELRLKSHENIPIVFRVDSTKKVVDVSIENVSLANHYRGSFQRVLVNKDFDALMKILDRKVKLSKKQLERAKAGS